MIHLILLLCTMKILMKKILNTKKCKSIFVKGYTQNQPEEVFGVSKIKDTVPRTYAISDLNGNLIIGSFHENEQQKRNQEEFGIEKVLKREVDQLYIKWKGHDNLFDSWIDKKDLE